jgi:hypothetical protein
MAKNLSMNSYHGKVTFFPNILNPHKNRAYPLRQEKSGPRKAAEPPTSDLWLLTSDLLSTGATGQSVCRSPASAEGLWHSGFLQNHLSRFPKPHFFCLLYKHFQIETGFGDHTLQQQRVHRQVQFLTVPATNSTLFVDERLDILSGLAGFAL